MPPYFWLSSSILILFEMYFHTFELFIYFCLHEWSLGVVVVLEKTCLTGVIYIQINLLSGLKSEVRGILGDKLCGRVCALAEISWAFPMLSDLGNGIPVWVYLCERDTTQ